VEFMGYKKFSGSGVETEGGQIIDLIDKTSSERTCRGSGRSAGANHVKR
jgi:hypothetical protein